MFLKQTLTYGKPNVPTDCVPLDYISQLFGTWHIFSYRNTVLNSGQFAKLALKNVLKLEYGGLL